VHYALPQIDKIFSDFQIPRSEYGVCAGFDQEKIRLGFFEQIQVFIRSEVHDMLLDLASIFAPFPAILFTEISSYDIPVSEAAGSTDTHTHPMAICLTCASQSDPPKGFGSKMESNRQNSGNNNEGSTDKWEESNEDKPSNRNENGLGQGRESEPSGEEGNRANWKADLSWDVISEICSSQPGEPRAVSQSLGTKGRILIEVYVHCYFYLSHFLILQQRTSEGEPIREMQGSIYRSYTSKQTMERNDELRSVLHVRPHQFVATQLPHLPFRTQENSKVCRDFQSDVHIQNRFRWDCF